ncbi:acyl carrier protein [Pichia kluyveri]|uniref:Acyl carrier protein n=1 Tax=Pichia kluyveri TaxID=36015 RepID=A0AAV5R8U5_PICKL|nr:acyl carrier protein [Pichia kluyveri]
MFRSIVNSSRLAIRASSAARTSTLKAPVAFTSYLQNNSYNRQVRFYSHAPELTKELINERIVELLESYSKTPENVELNANTSFSKDLGYDSFDVVEVIMEIEYEFSILIPDAEADKIKTLGQAVDFIAAQPDAC